MARPRFNSGDFKHDQRRLHSHRKRSLRFECLEERSLLAVDLVSANLAGGSGQLMSLNSSVSRNGRYVVFESSANDLVTNDGFARDIFRRDTQTGVTELVSISTTNTNGNGDSANPVVSVDGRYVAFTSLAANLITNDTNAATQDVFVRDMLLGVTSLVSVSTTGGSGSQASGSPSLSDDGRFIAFVSTASNLVTIDTNGAVQDVFLRDRTGNSTALISVVPAGNASGSGASANPMVSGNGGFVAFDSTASNLVAGDTNGATSDVFVRAIPSGPTTLVSVNRDNTGSGFGASTAPTLSDDGRFIAFLSSALDLTTNDLNGLQDVFVRDRTGLTTALVSATTNNLASGDQASGNATIADGGGHVVFTSNATNLVVNDTNLNQTDVFVRTLATNVTTLVSTSLAGGSGNSSSDAPAISADGRFVAFTSQASNLTADDTNMLIQDVFRRDLVAGQTVLVSFNVSASGSGQLSSSDPAINGDGTAISFSSEAANLVLNDTNGALQDIFFFGSSTQIEVTAPDFGGSPHVRVLDARNGGVKFNLFPYAFAFTGGVRVATGDVSGDGVPDIVTAAGRGGGPHVRVFSGVDGSQLPGTIGNFFPYAGAFTGGVFVATADINRDGRADVITGADSGGGPHVRVFSGLTGAVLTDIFPYAFAFTGGVRVAGGDVNGDTFPDIITAAGPGGGPHVRVFSGQNNSIIREFFAYTGAFSNGVYVSTGDINADGRADIITGPGAGGGPHVRVFSGLNNADLLNVFAFDPNFLGGVRVASGDVNGDGRIDVIAGTGAGTQARVRAFSGATGGLVADALAYPGFPNGIFVAGSKSGAPGGSPSLPFPMSALAVEAETRGLTREAIFDQPPPEVASQQPALIDDVTGQFVAFRSAKGRPFAERKSTLTGHKYKLDAQASASGNSQCTRLRVELVTTSCWEEALSLRLFDAVFAGL